MGFAFFSSSSSFVWAFGWQHLEKVFSFVFFCVSWFLWEEHRYPHNKMLRRVRISPRVWSEVSRKDDSVKERWFQIYEFCVPVKFVHSEYLKCNRIALILREQRSENRYSSVLYWLIVRWPLSSGLTLCPFWTQFLPCFLYSRSMTFAHSITLLLLPSSLLT